MQVATLWNISSAILKYLDKALDTYRNYQKVLYKHELSNLVKEKTCFENMQNPSCIDLLLINNSYAFQQTSTFCSGLLDCHKLVLTVLKTSIYEVNLRQITYIDYKKFYSLKFNNQLKDALMIENIDNCAKFDEKFLEVLDKNAPLKRKELRENRASYVSKALRKAIIRRSYLEKVYFFLIVVGCIKKILKIFQYSKSIICER